MTIKSLIFDLHGILIKEFPSESYVLKVKALLKEAGYPEGTYESWKKLGTISSKMEETGLKDEYLKALDSLETTEQRDGELIEALNRLKEKYILIVATNTSKLNAVNTMRDANIPEVFDYIITAEDVVSGKPDIEMYVLILEKTGFKASEILVFGDRLTDIVPAVKLGMTGIASNYDNFKEVIKWI